MTNTYERWVYDTFIWLETPKNHTIPTVVHVLALPSPGRGRSGNNRRNTFQAQARSMWSFFYNAESEFAHYDLKRGHEWMYLQENHPDNTYLRIMNEVPAIEHHSVWDFYDHIGYDYKKKKFKKR